MLEPIGFDLFGAPVHAVAALRDGRATRQTDGPVPRLWECFIGAACVGRAFGCFDRGRFVSGVLVSDHRTGMIRYFANPNDQWVFHARVNPENLMQRGIGSDRVGAVRRQVRNLRTVIREAKAVGRLLNVPVKAVERTFSGNAVIVLESPLLRHPEEYGRLQSIVDDALIRVGGCPSIVRYHAPAYLEPNEWSDLVVMRSEEVALRKALKLTEERLNKSLKRGWRTSKSGFVARKKAVTKKYS
tara:strand:- start:3620 stop:4348 length:729 start_codon:yes stop_codon:yes gene_type:complete